MDGDAWNRFIQRRRHEGILHFVKGTLQLLHWEYSEGFSIIYVINFKVNIVDEEK